jgi:hypothetical protein
MSAQDAQDALHPKNLNITESEPQKDETYAEWAKRNYGEKWETWMPWIEDQYLKWFGKDNKASYATKGKSASSDFTYLSRR